MLVERGAVTRMAWGDKQASVLGMTGPAGGRGESYSVYGLHKNFAELANAIGFSGYYFDALSKYYLLGNGYRSYSPSMMRFLSPDSLSPFSRGGLNAYGYCAGDPINRVDPDGRFWNSALTLKRVKVNATNSSPGLRRFMKSTTGKKRPSFEVADFTAEFKDAFDATPSGELTLDQFPHSEGMQSVRVMILYRSMKNAKRAYMALAVNEMDIDSRGMFPQQESQVVRMVEKLRDARDISIPFQEHDRGFQRAHAENMTKIEGWLKNMRMERDANALQLAEVLRRQQ
ncbi:RHS repeat-associated core domain-containing protein [Pseudomonas sp. NPDC008258]|uniref:RHS repeat-associated core domain-containing protein n=1 Tax=Pseudomonas sp. NPDC008258 TaxID=3364418 RepID=UPI0036EC361F